MIYGGECQVSKANLHDPIKCGPSVQDTAASSAGSAQINFTFSPADEKGSIDLQCVWSVVCCLHNCKYGAWYGACNRLYSV